MALRKFRGAAQPAPHVVAIFLASAVIGAAAHADPVLSESVSVNTVIQGQSAGFSANWSGFGSGETLQSASYTFTLVSLTPVYQQEQVQTGEMFDYTLVPQPPIYFPPGTTLPDGTLSTGQVFIPPPVETVTGTTPIYTTETVLTGFDYSSGPPALTVTLDFVSQQPIYTQEQVQTGEIPEYSLVPQSPIYFPPGTTLPDGTISTGQVFIPPPVEMITGFDPVYTTENVLTGYQPEQIDAALDSPGYYLLSVTSTANVGGPNGPYAVTSTVLPGQPVAPSDGEVVTVIPVPEPSSLSILGLAGVGLMLRRRQGRSTR